MTKNILIIGYGNPLRRDDGAGVIAVERLQQKIKYPNCTFITAHQLQPEMIAEFAVADVVLLVDADARLKPGVINHEFLSVDADQNHRITHFMRPHYMLWICKQIYRYAPETVLFSIGGYDFEYGEGLSAIVNLRLNRLVDQLAQFITQHSTMRQSA